MRLENSKGEYFQLKILGYQFPNEFCSYNKMKLLKVLMILTIVVVANVMLNSLLTNFFPDPEWASWGITMIILFIVIDVFIKFDPDLIPKYRPVFTNIRDTIVIVAALLGASAIVNIPEWIGDERLWVGILIRLLAIIMFFLFVFLLGTNQLKENFRLRKRKNVQTG